MYDLIGDIHGYATPLKQLLEKLGYRETDGLWSHPEERQVIFLGDFVDRGPDQIETVHIAKTMVEAGTALAVMGNHEFNAVAWASEDPNRPSEFLRAHSDKNRKQHRAYLEQVGEGSALHYEHIDWFKTLPLYLGLEGLRVVHACWDRKSLEVLDAFLDDRQCILEDAWPQLTRKNTPAFDAVETLIKGLEIPLPRGHVFYDKDDNPRHHIRTRWWELGSITYRDLAMVPAEAIHQIPHKPIPEDLMPGYEGDKPLFVGHYWLSGTPELLTPHIACLDYSIAGQGFEPGETPKLCAYRWDGEQELDIDKFVWVDRYE